MSLRVVSLLPFLFFAGFAAAGISAPSCKDPSWKASDNSLNQNPCTVAAYLVSTCYGGSYTINSVIPGHYYIPEGFVMNDSGCICNTVTYSLMSACAACQGGGWLTYSEFTKNCTTDSTPGSFPYPVPSGTRVPKWALSPDVVNFDPAIVASIGDTPEAAPGTIIGGHD